MRSRKIRTLVCGSTFGQFYLSALSKLPCFEIAGLLAQGSQRSKECADRNGIPLYTQIDELPSDIDLACVVMRSGVLGGDGIKTAKAIMEKGINVLFEPPLHQNEMADCLRTSQKNGVVFQVANLYTQLESARSFISSAKLLLDKQSGLFIDASAANQVLFPLLHILMQITGNVRPWSVKLLDYEVTKKIPMRILGGEIGGIPLLLRLHHQVDPVDPDNHLPLFHRITLGTAGGTLDLHDPHGLVIWTPRLFIPESAKNDFCFSNVAHLQQPVLSILDGTPGISQAKNLKINWPEAIGRDLIDMASMLSGSSVSYYSSQQMLMLCKLWQETTSQLGYPELCEKYYEYISVDNLSLDQQHDTLILSTEFKVENDSEFSIPVLLNNAVKRSDALISDITISQTKYFVHCLDEAVLGTMQIILQSPGGFDRPGKLISPDNLICGLGVAKRHQPLIKKWINVLLAKKRIEHVDQNLCLRCFLKSDDVESYWKDARLAWRGLGPETFIDYLRLNGKCLLQLMRDEQDAAMLLFPEGRMDIADAIYNDMITARYLNTLIAEFISQLAIRNLGTLRILEVGAGTGATTNKVVDVLNKIGGRCVAEYKFTDVSPFFLSRARKRYNHLPWMSFEVFDMEMDYCEQGMKTGEFDIIILAGVLNNSLNTDKTLSMLSSLLSYDGLILFSEATREHLEILSSQAFMMPQADDERKISQTHFLSVEQWKRALVRAGFINIHVFPDEDHPLSPLGQRLFVSSKEPLC
ncbi:Gfo/Idh/MocA family oxidoreductase [Salmonella enterica subsp. enterica serovar Eastbourne]|nr:Gfo/Idh/MocA family oxidoreductase [Salmonella enterica subsp. enterica serovar Eastbourne]EHC5907635.1 Gfo/Idh/MocA family oxidoreductase [Salmonella enterica subsp. enterica serovar Eastbourne]EJW4859512.1 Gfo/Idh/MocA family oxidoreductase [Salmonella enterica]